MAGGRVGWIPFEEVREGRITDSSFVVQLWYVHKGCPSGRRDCIDERYWDPVKFFERTYFSEGLKEVLATVVRRLVSGGTYNSVVLLHTGFGGGKSHTLLAIYHIAKRFKDAVKSRRLREFLEEIGVNPNADFRAAVAVFDGAAVDPVRLRDVYGAPNVWVYVLEELVRSAGAGKELLRKVRRYRAAAPGHEEIGEILAKLEDAGIRPVILIDEMAMYLRNLEVQGSEDARHEAEGLRIFLHNLAVAVANAKYAVLAIATPQQYEEESRSIIAVLSDVKRVARPTSIVGYEDAAAVLQAALLEKIDKSAATMVAEEYMRFYEREREHLPAEAVMPEYRERMITSYPFHPYLVDVLYGELVEVPGFQGTRDILRIMAWTLYWRNRSGETYDMLLLGDVDATRNEILDELLTRNEFLKKLRDAVSYDINVIQEIDESLARSNLPRIASLVYSAVLVRSAASKASRIDEIILGAASPIRGVDSKHVMQTIESLLARTAHLHRFTRDGEVYYMVKTRANIYMLVQRIASEILARSKDRVREKLLSEIKRIAPSTGECKIVIWPRHPGQVEDTPRIKLVLLDPEESNIAAGEARLLGLISRFTMYSQAGSNAAFRVHRNTVLYLVPDIRIYRQLLHNIARIMAIDRLMRPEEKQQYGLERDDVDELNRLKTKVLEEVTSDVAALYTKLYYPVEARPDGTVVFESVSLDPSRIRSEGLWRAVKEKLQEVGKLTQDISADYVLEIIVNRYNALRKPLSLRDVIGAFTEDPSSALIVDTENKVKEKLADLVKRGRLVALTPTRSVCMERPPLASDVSFAPCSAPEAREECIVAQGDEGLECRPKPPSDCRSPVWDSNSKAWRCEEALEHPAEPLVEQPTALQPPTLLPPEAKAQRLFYEGIDPYRLREKLQATNMLDKPVEYLGIRLSLAGSAVQQLLSGLRTFLQAIKDLAYKGRDYLLDARIVLKSESRVSKVTIDADTADVEQLNRLINTARSLGELKEVRLDLKLARRGGEPLLLKDLVEALNRKMLAKYPNLLLEYVEIKLTDI